MSTEESLAWVRSMRLQLLESLFELSGIHLQKACWANPSSSNPHYSFIEFVASSPLHSTEALDFQRASGLITEAEYEALVPLAQAIATYTPPHGDWHNESAVLQDSSWHQVTQTAAKAMEQFLSLSFNSQQWCGTLLATGIQTKSAP